ncbi:MAG: hypothetical protein Q9222_007316 [Ikaeria aurantiellina]
MPGQPTALGTFHKLPPEVRLMVWDFFLPQRWPDPSTLHTTNLWLPYQNSPSNDLAILRTNRSLNAEIHPHLYKNLSLDFVIRPHVDRWWIGNLKARPWQLRHIKFSEFQKIRIYVFAPKDQGDPAQTLSMRDSAMDLLCVLTGHQSVLNDETPQYSSFEQQWLMHETIVKQSRLRPELRKPSKLPPVELMYFDNAQRDIAHWCNRGPSRHKGDAELSFDNYFPSILSPFRHIKQLSDVTFRACAFDTKLVCIPDSELKLTKALRTASPPTKNWIGWIIDESFTTIALDKELDSAHGPSAETLRASRLQHWSHYEQSMRSLFCHLPARPGLEELHQRFEIFRERQRVQKIVSQMLSNNSTCGMQ